MKNTLILNLLKTQNIVIKIQILIRIRKHKNSIQMFKLNIDQVTHNIPNPSNLILIKTFQPFRSSYTQQMTNNPPMWHAPNYFKPNQYINTQPIIQKNPFQQHPNKAQNPQNNIN